MEYSNYHIGGFILKLVKALFADMADMNVHVQMINDRNEEKIQVMPRVMLQRGPYRSGTQFIGSGLQSNATADTIMRQDVNGMFMFLVEAREEGECEIISDYLRKFLSWSRPLIESKFGMQRFGSDIDISVCEMVGEDTEKFKITISVPYIVEDRWKVTDYSMRISHIFRKLEGL
jgi:hypothetical protein